jgi:hypothetical protein
MSTFLLLVFARMFGDIDHPLTLVIAARLEAAAGVAPVARVPERASDDGVSTYARSTSAQQGQAGEAKAGRWTDGHDGISNGF